MRVEGQAPVDASGAKPALAAMNPVKIGAAQPTIAARAHYRGVGFRSELRFKEGGSSRPTLAS